MWKESMTSGIKFIFVIAVLFIVIVGVKLILFPVRVVNQNIDTATGIYEKTMDSDNAIYNYEWFKEQEAHIRECLKNEEISKDEWNYFLSQLPGDRTKWSREDKQEESSLRGSYYALQKLTNKAMEDYNAKASMVTRNIFKDNLPSTIDRAWYTGQELMD
jgi:hypothetical protein